MNEWFRHSKQVKGPYWNPIETLLKQDKERDCEETSEPTERKNIEKFSKYIQDKGYMSFIRRSRGDDVLAACGQLRTESEKKPKPN